MLASVALYPADVSQLRHFAPELGFPSVLRRPVEVEARKCLLGCPRNDLMRRLHPLHGCHSMVAEGVQREVSHGRRTVCQACQRSSAASLQ